MALTSRPSIPEVIFERIKSDLTEFAFNFFQDGISLDVSERTYRIRLNSSGIQALDKASTTNAAGRVTFTLLNSEKSTLTASEYQFFLVEILADNVEKTMLAGTLRWSVLAGKTTGLVSAPDVSVNYITASQELMVALGVVDFGSSSSAASAAAAAASEAAVLEAQQDIITMVSQVSGDAEQVSLDTAIVIASKQATDQNLSATQALKEEIIDIIEDGAIYLGIWDPVTNIPALSTTVPVAGGYYEIGKTATRSEPTGSPVLYEEGKRIRSNGTVWQLGGGMTPSNKSVSVEKLAEWLQPLFQRLSEFSPYLEEKIDTDGNRLFAIRKSDGFIEGRFEINEISMQPNSVNEAAVKADSIGYSKLKADIKSLIHEVVDNTYSEWLRELVVDGYRIQGEKKDGTFFISKPGFPDGTLAENFLAQTVRDRLPTPAFMRLNAPNSYNVDREDDGMWRGKEIDMSIWTDYSGHGFATFPKQEAECIYGVNNTGESLQFRKTNGIAMRGKRYRGLFDPSLSTVIGTNLRGYYGNSITGSYPAFPTGATGDCWAIDAITTITANGLTFGPNDILVKTASGHDIQPGPKVTDALGAIKEGDFWNVAATRVFSGMQLTANERIVYLGDRLIGGPRYPHFVPSRAGEFFLMGEANSSFPPVGVSTRNGDVYNFASNATTTVGPAGVIGDMLVYYGGWGAVKGEMVTVENNGFFQLKCQSTSDWGVRRTSKATTRLAIPAKTKWVTVSQQANDSLVLYSDSLFGTNQVGQRILDLTGRAGNVEYFGGATSEEVLAMMRYHVRNGDPYAGRIPIMWHGQNNVSFDETQTKASAHAMASLIGAKQKRFVFWSVMGVRDALWTGSRITCLQFENARSGTNYISRIEDFYKSAYPKQWFSPRLALLEAAVGRNIPDPQFPGMTEAQVATTYGILPFSFFFEYAGKPFTASNLVYIGDWSSAGLPTGGVDKNYYRRIANGGTNEKIGQIIVNNSGTWVEYTSTNGYDNVHLSTEGAPAVAAKFRDFLTTINI